jgi:DNA-binding transcriptional regulator LsrR (DeoR family)
MSDKPKAVKSGNVTPEEMVQITIDWLNHGLTGKELEHKYGHGAPHISKLISRTVRNRWIRASDGGDIHVSRVQKLEQQLIDTFTTLRLALVVNTPTSVDTPHATPQDSAVLSDRVHQDLGKALARLCCEGLFRDNDRIGFGSGRGVYYTLQALRTMPRLRIRDTALLPLTGDVYAWDHARKLTESMDADAHVKMFGECLSFDSFQNRIGRPIIPKARVFKAARDQTWLGVKPWRPPSHALLGVGVLGPGHRFYEEAKTPQTNSYLSRIADELRTLLDLADSLTRPNDPVPYFPIGDISNNLFFVNPPKGVSVRPSIKKEIRTVITRINMRLLNVSESELKQINGIILVAGTLPKALALRDLLMNPEYSIQVLCTDVGTAEALLAEVQ